jgi:PEP-CTERM motif
VSECGTLCHGNGAHGRGDRRRGGVYVTYPLVGVQSTYWSRTSIDANHAVVFSFLGGDEAPGDKAFQRYGWAVRFGDSVSVQEVPVPEPATAVLFGIGLLALRLVRWWQGRYVPRIL